MNNDKERLLSDFYNAEFGDIIYAIRPQMKMEEDPEHKHSRGPFIVLTSVEDGLICFPCTSQSGRLRFEILDKYKELPKGGYINYWYLTKIEEEHFLYSLRASLSLKDKEQIKKHFDFYRSTHKYKDPDVLNYQVDTNYSISPRDIVGYNKGNYLVISEKENVLFLMPVNDYDWQYRTVRREDYDVNSKVIVVSKNAKIKFLSTMDLDEYIAIKDKLLSKDNYLSNIPLEKGNLLTNEDKYYYVYDIQGEDALCFECEPCSFDDEDLVTIGGEAFRPLFDNRISIDKDYGIKYIYNTSSIDEQEKITAKRKKHKRKSDMLHDIYLSENPEVKVGSIVEFADINIKYYITRIFGKKIEVINLEALLNHGEIVYQTFFTGDNYLSKCENISKEELLDIKDALESIGISPEEFAFSLNL